MMCVTVRASQPSDSIPTEMTFWICSPGFPGCPTVLTCSRNTSACCFLVSIGGLSLSSSSEVPVALFTALAWLSA